MALYEWGFTITSLPAAPKGINDASPPPAPEQLATAETRQVYAVAMPIGPWWILGLGDNEAWFDKLSKKHNSLYMQCWHALLKGQNNIDLSPFSDACDKMQSEPPYLCRTPLFAQARWEQIDARNIQVASTLQVATKEGVLNSKTVSEKFGAKVGINASGGYSGLSLGMSSEFSYERTTTYTIAFTNEVTVTNTVSYPSRASTRRGS